MFIVRILSGKRGMNMWPFKDNDKDMTAEELEKLMAEADKAWDSRDYGKALKLYKRAMKKKNGKAACRAGILYAVGKGTMSFYSKAVDCFRDAIDWKEIDAYNKLALMYDAGRGVGASSKHCADLYRDGMDEGSLESINNLAYMYEYGRGMPVNYEMARKLYEVAASAEVAVSMRHLGVIYEFGKGVDANIETAKDWYRKAKEKGDKKAENWLKALEEGKSPSHMDKDPEYASIVDMLETTER